MGIACRPRCPRRRSRCSRDGRHGSASVGRMAICVAGRLRQAPCRLPSSAPGGRRRREGGGPACSRTSCWPGRSAYVVHRGSLKRPDRAQQTPSGSLCSLGCSFLAPAANPGKEFAVVQPDDTTANSGQPALRPMVAPASTAAQAAGPSSTLRGCSFSGSDCSTNFNSRSDGHQDNAGGSKSLPARSPRSLGSETKHVPLSFDAGEM